MCDTRREMGAIAGALIGLGYGDDEALEAGAVALADEWIHASDLIAIGVDASAG